MRAHRWRRATILAMVTAMFLAACGGAGGGSDDDAAAGDTADTAEAGDTQTEAADDAEAAADDAETEAADEPVPGPSVTMTLSHGFPAEHPVHVGMIEPFVERVGERTDGNVDIEIHPGGALSPAPATYENVVAGAVDLGWSLQGYTPGRFPLIQIVEMPFVFESASQATEALWFIYEQVPEFQEEYSDVKVLALWTHDIGDLWTRDTPVETIDDVEGLTLRAPGPVQNALIESLGGSPVNMPAPEIFDSVERGVIDGVVIANSGLASFNLFEVLGHGVRCNCYVAPMFLAMDLAAWEQLSPEQQAAIDEIAGKELSMSAATAYDAAYDRVDQRLAESDIEIVDLTEEELDRWREAADGVVEQWIADREAEGLPGQQMYDLLREFLENN